VISPLQLSSLEGFHPCKRTSSLIQSGISAAKKKNLFNLVPADALLTGHRHMGIEGRVLSLHILDHHINRNSDEGLGALIHVGQPPNLPCYAGAEVAEKGIDRRQSLLELKVIKHCIAGDGAVCHAEETRLEMMDHGSKSIQLVGRIAIDLEHRNEFLDRTTELCNLTNSIECPPLFQCCEDISAPGHFLFYEIWSTQEVLEAHFLTEHFLAWSSWVTGKTVSEPEIRIGPMEVTTLLAS